MGSSSDKKSLLSLTNHELYVVTAEDCGQRSGMIVTWLIPATLVPDRPRIVVALSRCNYTTEIIERSGYFLAQMLSAAQYDMVPRFGLSSGRDHNKFTGIAISDGPMDLPLIPGTCGYMLARLSGMMDSGDRVIMIADVLEQHVNEGLSPLRVNEAFAALPPEQAHALSEKRKNDGIRDRELIASVSAPAQSDNKDSHG